ncbi:MAG: hypothetical protein ABEN55_04140 [Bradymonadaceae bacterium]
MTSDETEFEPIHEVFASSLESLNPVEIERIQEGVESLSCSECGGDVQLQGPHPGARAKYVFECQNLGCQTVEHWKDIVDARDRSVKLAQAKHQLERAIDRDVEESTIDQVADRVEKLREETHIAQTLKGQDNQSG